MFLLGVSVAGQAASPEATGRKPPTVLIHSGLPRGGFGDVASNLIMAIRIKQLRPDVRVVFQLDEPFGPIGMTRAPPTGARLDVPSSMRPGVAGAERHRPISVLVPGIQPGITLREGVEVVGDDVVGQIADLEIVFSADTQHNTRHAKAPICLVFPEYDSVVDSNRDSLSRRGLASGAGPSSFYLNPVPPAVVTRPELARMIQEEFGIPDLDLDSKGLAFAYQSSPTSATNYTLAALETYRKNPKKKGMVIFTSTILTDLSSSQPPFVQQSKGNHHLHLKAPGVDVIVYERMSLRLTELIIANTDLPIAVTGDVSLTLAMQYRKPFFYEMHPWKKSLAHGLKTGLKHRGMPTPFLVPLTTYNYKWFVDGFSDPKHYQKAQRAIGRYVVGKSLPDKLMKWLDFIQSNPPGHEKGNFFGLMPQSRGMFLLKAEKRFGLREPNGLIHCIRQVISL